MATKIAIVNKKGGVGKTSSIINIADALRHMKKKVLVIDLDPQYNATMTYNAVFEGEKTVFDVLNGAYQIERVWASRSINSNPEKRGKLTEILVHNYLDTKHNYQTSLLQFVANENARIAKMAVNQ